MPDDWYRIANEDEVASPALLVYPERIADNIVRMITAAGGAERLRPHVKTHKMPDVIRMEIERGITKFKVATIAEAEMTAAAGGLDVLLAYPVVGPAARRLARLAATHPRTTFRAITDSAVGIDGLAAAATAADVTLDVLLDLDVGFGRTGIRPGPDAAALYRRIAAAPNLTAGGLHAYDGHLRDADHGRLVAATEAAFTPVWSLRSELRAAGFAVPRTVVSGTPTFAILAARDDVEVGAGTTVLWDAGRPAVSRSGPQGGRQRDAPSTALDHGAARRVLPDPQRGAPRGRDAASRRLRRRRRRVCGAQARVSDRRAARRGGRRARPTRGRPLAGAGPHAAHQHLRARDVSAGGDGSAARRTPTGSCAR
jgi:D-serine deaminase-like pyridoxal phosphate-dependent protein